MPALNGQRKFEQIMATPKQREARKRRRQRQRNQGNTGNRSQAQNIPRGIQVDSNIRTVSLTSGSEPGVIKVSQNFMEIDGDSWPNLGRHLANCIQWRIRTARVSYEAADLDIKGRVAMLMSPVGPAWTPTDYATVLTRGGRGKFKRQSNWSSNTLGSAEQWHVHNDSAARLYFRHLPEIEKSKPDVDFALLTLHVTIQLNGHR